MFVQPNFLLQRWCWTLQPWSNWWSTKLRVHLNLQQAQTPAINCWCWFPGWRFFFFLIQMGSCQWVNAKIRTGHGCPPNHKSDKQQSHPASLQVRGNAHWLERRNAAWVRTERCQRSGVNFRSAELNLLYGTDKTLLKCFSFKTDLI